MKKSNKLFNGFRIWVLIIIIASLTGGITTYKHALEIKKSYKAIEKFPVVLDFTDENIGFPLKDGMGYATLDYDSLEYTYYNFQGEKIDKPKYLSDTGENSNEQTLEVIEGYPYLKDKDGNILYKGELAEKVSLVKDNLLLKQSYKKSTLYNIETKEEIVLPIEKVGYVNEVDYGDIKYIVKKNEYYENEKEFYILDKNFKIIPSDEYRSFSGFSNGIGLTDKGYVDEEFNLIFNKPARAKLNSFWEGLAVMEFSDSIKVIDEAFKTVFTIENVNLDEDSLCSENKYEGNYLILINEDGKYGIVDRKGKWIIGLCLDKISITDSLALVEIDGKRGIICLKN